jgi:hypothetical protein
MTDIVFKKLTREDGNKFCRFLKEIFGEGLPIDEKFYEHLHFKNPAGESIIYGAWDGEKLVGTNVLDWCDFRVNGKPLRITHSHSTATCPDYRLELFKIDNKIENIYSHLNHLCNNEAKKQGAILTYGFPNQHSLKPSIKFARFIDLGTIPILLDIFRCKEIISMKRPKWSQIFCSFLSLLPQLILSSRNLFHPQVSSRIQIQQVREISEEWDHFAEEMSMHYPVIQLRDSKYIRWRFLENPARCYQILEARCNGKLAGYLIDIVNTYPEREKNGILCGYIVDFLVAPTKSGDEVLQSLLWYSRRNFIDQKAVIATSICNMPSRFAKIFSHSGFWKAPSSFAPRPVHFTIQKLFFETESFRDIEKMVDSLKSWYLTMGDNDII